MPLLLVFLFVFLLFILSIAVVRKHERVGIFRFGQFNRVAGPGLIFVIFPVEQVVRINLNKDIDNWGKMPKMILDEKIKNFILALSPDKRQKKSI